MQAVSFARVAAYETESFYSLVVVLEALIRVKDGSMHISFFSLIPPLCP
jgi:hypothetical protein